jgi:hypothetical protein
LVVQVHAPVLPPYWNDQISHQTHSELIKLCGQLNGRLGSRWDGKRPVCQYTFDSGDIITLQIFGKTAHQFFDRLVRSRNLWAINRGTRDGKWWCEAKDLPLVTIPRRKAFHNCGRIPVEWEILFEDMLARAEPDYSILNLGPDRLPPIWVCNLCGREGENEEWPWRSTPGLAASDYISMCPGCGAKQSGLFEQIANAIKQQGFRPFQRMRDDYFFTI